MNQKIKLKLYVEITGGERSDSVCPVAYATIIKPKQIFCGWGILKDTAAAYAYGICAALDSNLIEEKEFDLVEDQSVEIISSHTGYWNMLPHHEKSMENRSVTKVLDEAEIWQRLAMFRHWFDIQHPRKPESREEMAACNDAKKRSNHHLEAWKLRAQTAEVGMHKENREAYGV